MSVFECPVCKHPSDEPGPCLECEFCARNGLPLAAGRGPGGFAGRAPVRLPSPRPAPRPPVVQGSLFA